jgi:hypothetical protein
LFDFRLQVYREAKDPSGCRATAQMWEQRGPKTANELYSAARFRAVTAAVQAQAPGDDAAQLAQEEADRAVAWLTKAVAAGFKDRAQMNQDADLTYLRQRDDYQKLLQSLPAN